MEIFAAIDKIRISSSSPRIVAATEISIQYCFLFVTWYMKHLAIQGNWVISFSTSDAVNKSIKIF